MGFASLNTHIGLWPWIALAMMCRRIQAPFAAYECFIVMLFVRFWSIINATFVMQGAGWTRAISTGVRRCTSRQSTGTSTSYVNSYQPAPISTLQTLAATLRLPVRLKCLTNCR